MNTVQILLIIAATITTIIGIVILRYLWKRRKEGKSKGPNYRALFILGVTFLPLGVMYGIAYWMSEITAFMILGIAFVGMGLSYLAIGLTHRDEWSDTKNKVDKGERT